MPATGARPHAAALLGYVSLAALFAWPLPLHLGSALLGAPGGDTGVYVWNLWVFRHEIVSHGAFPFFTTEILHATPPVPLTLHNYTPAANLLGLPLQALFGTIATFNLLVMASGVLSAYAMFVLLRQLVGDPVASWIGGVLYGFSPFMTARQMAHFSLVQAAALPLFALILHRIATEGPSTRRSVALGAVLALAYLSDPYYAVYCVLIGLFFAGWQLVGVEPQPERAPRRLRAVLDAAIVAVAILVVALLVAGGGTLEIGGRRLSVRGLYTPVLVLTLLALGRTWIALWPRVSWHGQPLPPLARAGLVAGLVTIGLLAPVIVAMAGHLGEGQWIAPPVHWRSSPPGVDLLALVAPNPVGTLTGGLTAGWLAARPDGLYENVASIPWTVLVVIGVASWRAGLRLPAFWVVFTASAILVALGPFIAVGGWNTHVPTPWAILRYLPVIGAARMPTRLTVLVTLGAAVLLAYGLRALGARSARPWVPAALVTAALLVELLPAPRTLYELRVPGFVRLVAADPRPVSVMHLPFGLRDGLSSAGDFSASAQLLQTFHHKPLVGGYLSRLPHQEVVRYRRIPLMDVLLDLSEGHAVRADRLRQAILQAYGDGPALNIGYVIVDDTRASPELVAFAREALDLQHVETDGPYSLYIVR